MNKEQKYTPKYWVAHNELTNDVYVSTLFKSLRGSQQAFEVVSEHVAYLSDIKFSLVEIKLVDGVEDYKYYAEDYED